MLLPHASPSTSQASPQVEAKSSGHSAGHSGSSKSRQRSAESVDGNSGTSVLQAKRVSAKNVVIMV
jgi:hypothetical protein